MNRHASHDYALFSTPEYLTGYSRKILLDLTKAARMYNGRLLHVFRPGEEERCSACTNAVTGEVLSSSCPVCRGTGVRAGWTSVGRFWSYVDFGPTYSLATENGNSENPGGVKEQFIVLGAPLLRDQDLLVPVELRRVFKIYDVEPHIIALRGEVLAQMAQASPLSSGCQEYSVITW